MTTCQEEKREEKEDGDLLQSLKEASQNHSLEYLVVFNLLVLA